ncbi:MAG: SAM-dependent methyltransferase [Rhodobacteraceae bacterium]|nr:SAM-dependent methyltransferase [Paracoccaceae bacterium]
MTKLAAILKARLAREGAISVADYMALCLLHPEHGYYTNRDPLGVAGDFTTAPEISQMFGEMLGLMLVQAWQDQGSPSPFVLAEPGPGRGTLMADILRVATRAPGFGEALRLWLVEASPHLRQRQQALLAAHDPQFADSLSDLPDLPLFLIANEFFDALPVRQFLRAEGGWRERMVVAEGEGLAFGYSAPLPFETLEDRWQSVEPGAMVEATPAAGAMLEGIATRIAERGGVALIVDYGDSDAPGDTFQALKGHRKVDPLADPGAADLTAHVNFAALMRAARAVPGIAASRPTPQGVLLERLGITGRAHQLAAGLQGPALEAHISAHRRLTHPDEMGSLFKALAIYPADAPPPPGLDVDDA